MEYAATEAPGAELPFVMRILSRNTPAGARDWYEVGAGANREGWVLPFSGSPAEWEHRAAIFGDDAVEICTAPSHKLLKSVSSSRSYFGLRLEGGNMVSCCWRPMLAWIT